MLTHFPHRSKVAAAIIAAAASIAMPAAGAAVIKVCTFPQSPTRMVDQKVAKAVFDKLALQYTNVDLGAELGAGATSQDKVAGLLKSTCDVFMGIPVSDQDAHFGKLPVSRGYARADFVRFSLPGTKLAPKAAGLLAVAYRAPSQLIAAEEKVQNFEVVNTPDKVIAAVVDGSAEKGIAWIPSLAAYEHDHAGVQFKIEPTHARASDWHLTFVAGTRNKALLGRISHAIAALARKGDLGQVTGALTGHAMAGRSAALGTARIVPAVFNPAAAGVRLMRVSDEAGHTADFAAAQVEPGKQGYAADCARCHGDKLEGRTAPALVGQGFAPSEGSTMTVGGIYQYMITNMPADKPGKLKPQEYADIMAFLLSDNGYQPSGKALSPDKASDDTTPFNSYVK